MTIDSSSDIDFSDIDVTDLDVFAQRHPHEWFTFLREQAPVWRHPASEGSDGEEFWVVSSFEHVTEVHRSGLLYSHQTGPGRNGAGGIALTDLPAEMGPGLQMVSTDPPQHTRYRKLVNSGFTPRMIRRLEESLRERTTAILDRVTPKGECDFVTEVAAELPLIAIAEIIGVPEEDRSLLFDWSNRMIGGQDDEFKTSEVGASDEYANTVMEMAIYAHGLTDKKREVRGDDLWSRLIDASVTMEDGSVVELSELERDLFFTLLVIAGNETTRNAISKGLIAFMDHPDQWQRWLEHPEMADTMVDEILRWTSPVNFFRRTATADTILGGQRITTGEKVVLWYPSANRDEAQFPDADSFDIARTPNNHVAFGAGGPHFCLGSNLAKLEIKVMFEELGKRVPDIHQSGPTERLRMNLVDGIKHLPVSFNATPSS
ncbi:MAG: cytochrome P450 [Actinobacteria bacterium]|nr:cytochrome P450 [Actinomycetota bacterium]